MDELIAKVKAAIDEEELRANFLYARNMGHWICPECGGGMATAEGLDDHLFANHGRNFSGHARRLRQVAAHRELLALTAADLADDATDGHAQQILNVLAWVQDVGPEPEWWYDKDGQAL